MTTIAEWGKQGRQQWHHDPPTQNVGVGFFGLFPLLTHIVTPLMFA